MRRLVVQDTQQVDVKRECPMRQAAICCKDINIIDILMVMARFMGEDAKNLNCNMCKKCTHRKGFVFSCKDAMKT